MSIENLLVKINDKFNKIGIKSAKFAFSLFSVLLIFFLFFIFKIGIVHSAGGIINMVVGTDNCSTKPLGPDEICTSGLYPSGVDNSFNKLPLFAIDKHYLLENVTSDAGYYPCQPGSGTPNNPKFPAPVYRLDEYNSPVTNFTNNPANYSGAVSNGSYAGTQVVPYVYDQLYVYPWTGTYIHPYVFTTPTASWIGNDTFGHDTEYFFNYALSYQIVGPGAYSNLDPDGNSGVLPTVIPSDENHLYDPIQHPNGICFNPSDGVMFNPTGNYNLPNPQSGLTFNDLRAQTTGLGTLYTKPNDPASQISEYDTENIPYNTYVYSINNPTFPAGNQNKFYVKLGSNVNKSNLTFQITGQVDNALAVRLNGCYLSAEGNVPVNPTNPTLSIGQQAYPVNQMTMVPTTAYTHYEVANFANKTDLFDFSLGSCQINTGSVGNTLSYYLKSGYDLTGMIITSIDFTDKLPSTVPISHPYFTVSSGDVSAGNQVASSGACLTTGNSSVQSWNNNSGSYFGAGAQGAVFASGNIANFISDLKFSSGQPPPSTLTFSNSNTNPSSYGGYLSSLPCFNNYYKSLSSSPLVKSIGPGIDLSALNSGIYQATGSVVIYNTGGNIAGGKDITILVNGNVTIENNIEYGPYNISNIPRVNIIVENGNINIASTVTVLHGFYSTNASFVTCYNLAINSESSNSSVCSSPLTIYGSVFASTIDLDRTYGDQLKGTGPAETFNNSPEFWIPASSTCQSVGSCLGNNYANESVLPPVL